MCSSQASVASKSYFFFSSSRGASYGSHMPSSALSSGETTKRASNASSRRCMTTSGRDESLASMDLGILPDTGAAAYCPPRVEWRDGTLAHEEFAHGD